MILVNARLIGSDAHDTTGQMIVDTGAGFLTLDLEVANSLGLADRSARNFQLARDPLSRFELGALGRHHDPRFDSSKIRTRAAAASALQLDQVAPIMLIDLDPVYRVTDRKFLGLVGAHVFKGRALHIDYADEMLAIIPAADDRRDADRDIDSITDAQRVDLSRARFPKSLLGDAVAVPFRIMGDGKIVVRARIANPRPPRFSKWLTLIVDTGATKSALFAKAIDESVAERDRWPTLHGLSAQNLYGSSEVEMARVPEVELDASAGFVRAQNVVFGITHGPLAGVLERSLDEVVHGVLGHSFLKHYKILIDYPRRVLWLTEASGADDRPYEFTHVGIQIERHESMLRVRSLATDSPAARKGIRVGDEVIEINHEPIDDYDLVEVTRLLEGPRGSIVRVTVQRGRMRVTYSMVRRELL